MDEVALILRLLILILFSISTAILFYAYKKRSGTYHLIGIAGWCIHVIAFTVFATLYVSGILTIDHLWLNIWSNAVRLHGGLVALSLAVFYATRPKPVAF